MTKKLIYFLLFVCLLEGIGFYHTNNNNQKNNFLNNELKNIHIPQTTAINELRFRLKVNRELYGTAVITFDKELLEKISLQTEKIYNDFYVNNKLFKNEIRSNIKLYLNTIHSTYLNYIKKPDSLIFQEKVFQLGKLYKDIDDKLDSNHNTTQNLINHSLDQISANNKNNNLSSIIREFISVFILIILGIFIYTKFINKLKTIKELLHNPNYTPEDLSLDKPKDEVSVILSDITNLYLKLHEEKKRSEASNRAKSLFLANMSHEIRTPMNGILGNIDLLEHSTLNNEQKEMVETIQFSSNALLNILNDILDLSKIESGKIEIVNNQFDLHKMISETLIIFKPKLQDTGNKITLNYNTDYQLFLSDSTRIRQIIINLINNAVKFSAKQDITITVSSSNSDLANHIDLKIEVIDQGIGIPPEQLECIFEPFAQADEDQKVISEGIGLGLPISRQLAQLLGGTLNCKSTLNEGSVFNVEFPIQTLQSIQEKPTGLTRDYQLTAIVAEDNKINLKVISKLLEKIGIKIIHAANGQEVLDMIDKKHDLIFMDIKMPVLDGVEATEALLTHQYQKPIIAVTANMMRHDVERYNKIGFSDVIGKPVKIDDFVQALDPLFDH